AWGGRASWGGRLRSAEQVHQGEGGCARLGDGPRTTTLDHYCRSSPGRDDSVGPLLSFGRQHPLLCCRRAARTEPAQRRSNLAQTTQTGRCRTPGPRGASGGGSANAYPWATRLLTRSSGRQHVSLEGHIMISNCLEVPVSRR